MNEHNETNMAYSEHTLFHHKKTWFDPKTQMHYEIITLVR